MTRILFVDNDQAQVDFYEEKLREAGYDVVTALTKDDGKRALLQPSIDLAVLDLRLVDEREELDHSGLHLACTVRRDLPKILFSNYGSREELEAYLRPPAEGLPPALEFVDKRHGVGALLEAIKYSLRVADRYRHLTANLAESIQEDRNDVRHQARVSFKVSVWMAGGAVAVVFMAAILATMGTVPTATLTAVAGALATTMSALFFRRSTAANERSDQYHRELLQIRQLEILLAACDQLNGEQREQGKQSLIATACAAWFPRRVVRRRTRTGKIAKTATSKAE